MTSEDDIMKQKPDLDTESFRAWIVDKESSEAINEETKESNPLIVKLENGFEMKLVGFSSANLPDGKPAIAYKFRHDKKLFLYYNFLTENDGEDYRRAVIALQMISEVAEQQGYEFQDQALLMKSISVELPGMAARAKLKAKEELLHGATKVPK